MPFFDSSAQPETIHNQENNDCKFIQPFCLENADVAESLLSELFPNWDDIDWDDNLRRLSLEDVERQLGSETLFSRIDSGAGTLSDENGEEEREVRSEKSSRNATTSNSSSSCSGSPVVKKKFFATAAADDDDNNQQTGTVIMAGKTSWEGESKAERPNACVVCGRTAHCCHFNVPSCLGCRSFFRRSVLGQRNYICHKNGKCRINQGELCRACRLDRCILGGMKIQAIRVMPPDTDLPKLVAKLDERRLELLTEQCKRDDSNNNNNNRLMIQIEQPLFGAAAAPEVGLLHSLLYLDDKLVRIRYSDTEINPDLFNKRDMLHIVNHDQQHNLLAKADTFTERRRAPKSFQYFVEEVAKGHFCLNRPNWLHIDIFLCLELARTLPAIRQLSLEDKILLLNANLLPLVVFSQCFYSVCMENNEFVVFPTGFTPICVRDDSIHRRMFYDHACAYKRIGLSRQEFLLLRIILLLRTASVEGLSTHGCQTAQMEVENCSNALMCHERARLGDVHGAQRYAELMFFVNETVSMGNEHRNFLVTALISIISLPKLRLQHLDFLKPDLIANVILGIGGTGLRKKYQQRIAAVAATDAAANGGDDGGKCQMHVACKHMCCGTLDLLRI